MNDHDNAGAFDLGLVVSDGDRALAFYRDAIGLAFDSTTPIYDGAMFHKLNSGPSVLKLIAPVTAPAIVSAPGSGDVGLELADTMRAIMRSAGFRYLTINVSGIDEIVDRCVTAGYPIIVPLQELGYAPGTFMAMVADPDGNWVELLQKP